MHFPCKRLIAHLLLFSHLVSSCVPHSSLRMSIPKRNSRYHHDPEFSSLVCRVNNISPTPSSSNFKDLEDSALWLCDDQIYNIIRIIYPNLYSDQIVRLDLAGPAASNLDTLRSSISSYISSKTTEPFTSLAQINGIHWVTVSIACEGPSLYHAYYANSLDDPTQDSKIFSALNDSGIRKIHKLKVSQQQDSHNCGIHAITNANAKI